MVSIKKLLFHLIVAVIVFIGSIDQTNSSKQCKSTVMNVIMKQCSNIGIRNKRNVEPQENEGEIGEPGNLDGHNIARRQIISDAGSAIANLARPIMGTAITNALSGRSYIPGIGRFVRPSYSYPPAIVAAHYPVIPPYFVPQYPQPIPYQPESKFSGGFLPLATGDDLGFELSTNEIEELYEVFERSVRSSHKTLEQAKTLFFELAAKCCQNEELCQKDHNIISCV